MTSDSDEQFTCAGCGTVTDRDGVIRTETIGGLDPTKWQTLCCPDCGRRVQTVFVGDE